MTTRRKTLLIDLEQATYEHTYRFQKMVHNLRCRDIIRDSLIMVEHPSVYTIGRAGEVEHFRVSRSCLNQLGIDIYEVDRGGSVTYHGLGQLVVYPIFHLSLVLEDILQYLRLLEEVIIRVLDNFDLTGYRFTPYTGVWVEGKKVAAIGVSCKHSVTMHGFAINVNTDLKNYLRIYPCGIKKFGVTSMSQLLNNKIIPMEEVKRFVRDNIEAVFDVKLEPVHWASISREVLFLKVE